MVCWFLLVSCFVVFCLDLARTRLPSAVGPLGGGGGVSIYIYIYIYITILCYVTTLFRYIVYIICYVILHDIILYYIIL